MANAQKVQIIGADGSAATVTAGSLASAASAPAGTPGTQTYASTYETVAASQTGQVLGAAGAIGDYLSHIIIVPGSTSPGNVVILDNAVSITVFAGGALSLTNLAPFVLLIGASSVSGAWKVTTGANIEVIAVGRFT